jgi:hypothetical protein
MFIVCAIHNGTFQSGEPKHILECLRLLKDFPRYSEQRVLNLDEIDEVQDNLSFEEDLPEGRYSCNSMSDGEQARQFEPRRSSVP